MEGAALETLVLQELTAINERHDMGYEIFYWHTSHHVEVDFVLYGEKGLLAIEVKRGRKVHPEDFKGLKTFKEDYPMAKAYLLYGGDQKRHEFGIVAYPIHDFLKQVDRILMNR